MVFRAGTPGPSSPGEVHPGTRVADIAGYRPSSVATAVSHSAGVARIRVGIASAEGTREHMETQTEIYRAMADAGVSLDMFTPLSDSLVVSVAQSSFDRACEVLRSLDLDYEVLEGLAKVTLVGAGMHGVPGVMARMSEYLLEAGVTVLQTADSHTTISVLVPQRDAERAVQALHDGFELRA